MIFKFLLLWLFLATTIHIVWFWLVKSQRKFIWVLTRSVLLSLGISLPLIALLMLINNFSGI